MVPPTINKFYIADLAPGRSIVEHYVAAGQQVFMMSWRNPDERHAEWGLDTYGQAILDAMDAVERVTGQRAGRRSRRSAPAGSSPRCCWPTSPRPAARTGSAALSLAVTVLDWSRAGTVSALMDEESVKAATEKSRKKGYLDGAGLAEVFAWLRPNDLVWNYWVNNYLQGKQPPNFDILFWNADTTRMSAALHRDFIDIAIGNALTEPGKATMLGTPVDLSTVTVDSYVTAGIADHLCPWQACYRSTQLLGGDSRFILSTSGHIASLVNPPGNPKSTFQVAGLDAGRPAGVAGAGGDRPGLLVAGLHDLARRALGRGDPRADEARRDAGACWPTLPAPMSSTSRRAPADGGPRTSGRSRRPAGRCASPCGRGRTSPCRRCC